MTLGAGRGIRQLAVERRTEMPEQKPVKPQEATGCLSHSLSGSVPPGTAAQLPTEPATSLLLGPAPVFLESVPAGPFRIAPPVASGPPPVKR